MPDPMTVGVRMDQRSGVKIASVEDGSLGARSGLLKGDEVLRIEGAPVVSLADVAWALHRAGAEGVQDWVVERGGEQVLVRMELAEGWRTKSDIESRVGTWQMRAMVLGGMVLRTAPESKRAELGLSADDLGLVVQGLGEYGEHAAAKNAGFRKGDVILRIEGVESREGMSESVLIGELLSEHLKPRQLTSMVLRDGRRLELRWPIQ
jgi:membrane-associated protease RseP (regulator of RpoE activity)